MSSQQLVWGFKVRAGRGLPTPEDKYLLIELYMGSFLN